MKITVYSTPNCGQCRMTYKALDRAGIAYEVVDLSQDAEKLEELRQQGYLQAPIVMAGTETWTGFRPDKIKALAA
jgi:glutaredoxin-like protein NrdH